MRPEEPIGSKKARRPHTLIFFNSVFEGFWPLGGLLGRLLGHLKPSWGGLGASFKHGVSYLEPCRAILSDLGGHLGLSEAPLEPSLAILGALTPRDRACPGPEEVVRGRGKTLPEEEEGGWREEGGS